jgi:TatD DNase family protein
MDMRRSKVTANLIDMHFHLDLYRNHAALYDLINAHKQYTLCVTNSPCIFLSCKQLYPETQYVKFALGAHPKEVVNAAHTFEEFIYCFDKSQYIGEIGLDYRVADPKKKSEQLSLFTKILAYANGKNRILSIHIRRAEEDAIQTIRQFPKNQYIIHWFTGNKRHLNSLLQCNCYFSLNVNMLTDPLKQALISSIPHNRILVESDGPFSKIDGSKFSPENLISIYQHVGNTLGIEEIESVVYSNFKNLLMSVQNSSLL